MNINAEAFGGKKLPSYERGREIWKATVHPFAVWEGPTFEKPVRFVGYEANAAFNEFLLSVVPGYNMKATKVHLTPDPSSIIVEISGFGHTVDGGTYTQQYFSLLHLADGKFRLMREFCNPFETYKAFGKQRWEDAIDDIAKLNIELPEEAATKE
ncbi:MAG: PhzA/PhzB family protein [Parasphingorhabdus sp.]|uniref:nuclear transport factor 2 family protein n=1 Tax=Parasphingorhabdus sp. TaxID=2709688 RepID=UPI003002505D